MASSASLSSAGSSNSTSSVSMSAAEQGMVRPSRPVMYQWLHQLESWHALHKTFRNSCDGQVSSMAGGSELRSALIHFFLGTFHASPFEYSGIVAATKSDFNFSAPNCHFAPTQNWSHLISTHMASPHREKIGPRSFWAVLVGRGSVRVG